MDKDYYNAQASIGSITSVSPSGYRGEAARQDIDSLNTRLATLGDEISEFVHMARSSADKLFDYEAQNQPVKPPLADKEVRSAHDLLDRCFELTHVLRNQLNRF